MGANPLGITFMSDEELRQLIASNARSIQAMLEQRETDRLHHEEQLQEMKDWTEKIEDMNKKLANMQERLINRISLNSIRSLYSQD
jgi:predicted Holliday junction resolvase-like endonuclease